jgi:hypothetical protein
MDAARFIVERRLEIAAPLVRRQARTDRCA